MREKKTTASTFPTSDNSALEYIFDRLYSKGRDFKCGRCSNTSYWIANWRCIICQRCQHQRSVTAGTIFHQSPQPLRAWFQAMWLFSQHSGVNALCLQRKLRLGSYQTAWLLLHKLRRATARAVENALIEPITIGYISIGGSTYRAQKSLGQRYNVVLIAVGKHPSDIILRYHPKPSLTAIVGFVRELDGIYFRRSNLSGRPDSVQPSFRLEFNTAADKIMPTEATKQLHSVATSLKVWLQNTYRGRIAGKYFQSYLDEYAFRFSFKDERNRYKVFDELALYAIVAPPIPFQRLRLGEYRIFEHKDLTRYLDDRALSLFSPWSQSGSSNVDINR